MHTQSHTSRLTCMQSKKAKEDKRCVCVCVCCRLFIASWMTLEMDVEVKEAAWLRCGKFSRRFQCNVKHQFITAAVCGDEKEACFFGSGIKKKKKRKKKEKEG